MRSWLYRRLTSFPLKINKFCMTLFAPVNECNIFSQWVQEIFGAIMFFYIFNFLEDIHFIA